MDDIWIVAANHTDARILACRKGREIRELETLLCPEARQPERAVLTAAPGRSHDRQGAGRHAMEPHTDVSEQLAHRFAHRIAEYVEAGRKKNAYRQLVLVAAPDFLGLLREALGRQCLKLVIAECRKNIVTLDPEDIVAALPEPVRRALHTGDG